MDTTLREGASTPFWKYTSSWFIYGDHDFNIPPIALSFMFKYARAEDTVVVKGGSHMVMADNPDEVAKRTQQAAVSN